MKQRIDLDMLNFQDGSDNLPNCRSILLPMIWGHRRNLANNEARNYRQTPAASETERWTTAAAEQTPRRVPGRRPDPERRNFVDRMRDIAAEADTQGDVDPAADELTMSVSDYDVDGRPDQHRQTGPRL